MPELAARFPSLAEAWEAYLAYAPAARRWAENEPRRGEGPLDFELRGEGRWRRDCDLEVEGTFSLRERRLGLLRVRRREWVRAGFLEFAGDVPIDDSGRMLSDLADFCLAAMLEWLRAEGVGRTPPSADTLSVIGLGKLGGQELNLSSDIDLMFVHQDAAEGEEERSHLYYQALAEKLARWCGPLEGGEPLYRVDLRLRPEGDAGVMSRPLGSCENYYATHGEMWERLALLKARGAAGDGETAYEFLRMMQGFVYARNLLPASLGDIARLRERGERENVAPGDADLDLKLGRGGIRDIEFFIQGHQLLHGGRQAILHTGNTLRAIGALRKTGLLPAAEAEMLADTYRFWRRLEHRVQMREHRQTHLLPKDPRQLGEVAASLGMSGAEELWERQVTLRRRVRALYDDFYDPVRGTVPGVELDAGIFHDPERARELWRQMRSGSGGFHTGPRTEQVFERFSRLLEGQLRGLPHPDETLVRLGAFVERYGPRSLLFESLARSPKALELLLAVFDASRHQAEVLQADPALFEEVARGDLDTARDAEGYRELFGKRRTGPELLEDWRLFHRQELLRLVLRFLLKLEALPGILAEHTALADATVRMGLEAAGNPGDLAVIALGKWGGGDLGFGSDLDLLLVGENEEAAKTFSRLMLEKTAHGGLYRLDFRLRPYGEGNLSVPAGRYRDYYAKDAQLWEIQALGRARAAGGAAGLAESFFAEVVPVWRERGRDAELPGHLRHMRERMEKERCKSGRDLLEFKTGRGGLADIEFALAFHHLRRGDFCPGTREALRRLEEARPLEAGVFGPAYDAYRTLETWLRIDENAGVSHLPRDDRAREVLGRRMGYGVLEDFEKELEAMKTRVREAFERFF